MLVNVIPNRKKIIHHLYSVGICQGHKTGCRKSFSNGHEFFKNCSSPSSMNDKRFIEKKRNCWCYTFYIVFILFRDVIKGHVTITKTATVLNSTRQCDQTYVSKIAFTTFVSVCMCIRKKSGEIAQILFRTKLFGAITSESQEKYSYSV